MKIALAQINPTVGALSDNSDKIFKIIQEYSSQCDLIVFPEMCLTGYPPQDLLLDEAFIKKASKSLEEIASGVKNTPVILGTIRKENDALYNTAAVLENGEVVAPIENMRFDDSIYNFFGDNLESVTDKVHLHPTVQTYEGRELGGIACPGILLKSFELTI